MSRKVCLILLLLGLVVSPARAAEKHELPIPPAAEILRTLRPGHPRLGLSAGGCLGLFCPARRFTPDAKALRLSG